MECKVRMTRTTHVLQWNWTEGFVYLPTQQDLLVPLTLALGGLFLILCFGLFLVHPDIASPMVL